MPSIKFKLGAEVRRVHLNKECLTFTGLVSQAKALFPSTSGRLNFSFLWVDDEDDMVRCCTDDEVTEAVTVMSEMQQTLTFYIAEVDIAGVSSAEKDLECGSDRQWQRLGSQAAEQKSCSPLKKESHAKMNKFVKMGATVSDEPVRLNGNSGEVDSLSRCPYIEKQLKKYSKMRAVHPEERVRQRMTVDGIPQAQIDAFFATGSFTDHEFFNKIGKRKLEKYSKMRTMLPDEAVRQKMAADGASPADYDFVFGNADVPASCHQSFLRNEPEKHLKKYSKMRAVHPEERVRQRMTVDGIPQAQIEAFFASGSFTDHEFFNKIGKRKLEKYTKMRTMLPDEAVRQKMAADGASPADFDFVFGNATAPAVPVASAHVVQDQRDDGTAVASGGAGGGAAGRGHGGLMFAKATELRGFPRGAAFKPMARFIRDVTIPDGTTAAPGTVLQKTWCLRNDGVVAWPAGTVLVCVGADGLCAPGLVQPVPLAAAGTEVDLTVQLQAPQTTGRHLAYFRLRAPDGRGFGHRFWADILVNEEVPNTVTVDATADASIAVAGSFSLATAFHAPSDGLDATNKIDNVDNEVGTESFAETSSPASVPAVIDDESLNGFVMLPAVIEGLAEPHSSTVAVADAADTATKWAKELRLLADMGFTNEPSLLPLLEEHVRVPVAMRPELGGAPAAEGMQRVIAVLLSQSGLMA